LSSSLLISIPLLRLHLCTTDYSTNRKNELFLSDGENSTPLKVSGNQEADLPGYVAGWDSGAGREEEVL
jgi:hypothetical protein